MPPAHNAACSSTHCGQWPHIQAGPQAGGHSPPPMPTWCELDASVGCEAVLRQLEQLERPPSLAAVQEAGCSSMTTQTVSTALAAAVVLSGALKENAITLAAAGTQRTQLLPCSPAACPVQFKTALTRTCQVADRLGSPQLRPPASHCYITAQ
jgi:hypothetical protein